MCQSRPERMVFIYVCAAPVEKLVRISIIKGVKGTPYGGALQSSLRDRLVNNDKYEEAEEEALEKLVAFFQPHTFPKGSNIVYHWPSPSTVKVFSSSFAIAPHFHANTHSKNQALPTPSHICIFLNYLCSRFWDRSR